MQSGGGAARDDFALFLECCIRFAHTFDDLRIGARRRSTGKGGFGSYSMASCARLARSSPNRLATSVKAKSIPDVTPAPVIRCDRYHSLLDRHHAENAKLIER